MEKNIVQNLVAPMGLAPIGMAEKKEVQEVVMVQTEKQTNVKEVVIPEVNKDIKVIGDNEVVVIAVLLEDGLFVPVLNGIENLGYDNSKIESAKIEAAKYILVDSKLDVKLIVIPKQLESFAKIITTLKFNAASIATKPVIGFFIKDEVKEDILSSQIEL